MKRIQLPKAGLAVLGTTGLAITLAGCGVNSPATITTPYAAADGANGQIGDTQLLLRDMLVIGTAVGRPASILGTLVNDGDSTAVVALSADPDSSGTAQPAKINVTVPANSAVQIGPGAGQVAVDIPELSAAPGALVQISAVSADGGKALVSAPVLPPTGIYAGMTPAPTTPVAVASVPTDTSIPTPTTS